MSVFFALFLCPPKISFTDVYKRQDGFCVRCVKIVHQRALYGFLFGDACFEALFYQMGQ